MNAAFLITCYDTMREARFTVDLLRNKWVKTKHCPIVIVISGDTQRNLQFNDDKLTRVVHLDDIVGVDFNNLVSTSIMRQIRHGMIEVKDFARSLYIDNVVHMHGDILLLNEKGFVDTLENFNNSDKFVAADPVSAQRSDYIHFDGYELMPQIFAAKYDFCLRTSYLFQMDIEGDLERRSTEWALIGNLKRATRWATERKAFEEYVCVIEPSRQQWGEHKGWGGWIHYGNMLHCPKEKREQMNEAALRSKGVHDY